MDELDEVMRMKQNLIMIGFMGTGKTSIGKGLAEKLGWASVDTDQWIEEQQGMKVREIFETFGEPYFRQLETSALTEILKGENQVVMTGGGAPIKPENKEIMLRGGIVIALQATVQTIIDRLKQDSSRPLLQGDLEERVTTLMEQRKDVYSFAPIQIDTTNKSMDAIVSEIQRSLKERVDLS